MILCSGNIFKKNFKYIFSFKIITTLCFYYLMKKIKMNYYLKIILMLIYEIIKYIFFYQKKCKNQKVK